MDDQTGSKQNREDGRWVVDLIRGIKSTKPNILTLHITLLVHTSKLLELLEFRNYQGEHSAMRAISVQEVPCPGCR